MADGFKGYLLIKFHIQFPEDTELNQRLIVVLIHLKK